jgi:hypothetical protein
MLKRLYDHLTALARRYAPHLVTQQPPEQAIKPLASGLSREGILVLAGLPGGKEQNEIVANINAWVGLYIRLYEVLVEELFPRHTRIQAEYLDHFLPPILMLEGEADHVVRMIAGYIIPYIAVRQGERLISDAELDGLMRRVLDELEGGDLKPAVYDRVKRGAIVILHDLLRANVQQIALTDFIKPIFQNLPPIELPKFDTPKPEVPVPPASLPEPPPATPVVQQAAPAAQPIVPQTPPSAPPILPETPPQKMDTQVMFASKIPIFFKKPASEDKSSKSRAPLPPPDKKPK